jgi:hypothetical protein
MEAVVGHISALERKRNPADRRGFFFGAG